MGFILYLRLVLLRIIVFFLRLRHRRMEKRPLPTPDLILQIPSRDSGRTIKAHVYQSSKPLLPSPVLVNFHGSGFIMPLHGSDDIFCRHISTSTSYTVLDIQYRLSPENPFPAPLHDIEDVVKYIHSRPKEFDSSKLSISGFSAGANLSLSASSMILPKDTFRAVLAFYPPADLANHPSTKTAPDTSGKNIPPFIAGIFDASYFQSNDPQDPRISPFYAPAERFPRNILIVTPARDYLANEGEVLAKKIEKQGGKGRYVMHRRLEGVGHAWDKAVEKGSHEERMRDEAYAAAVDVLKR